MRERMNENHLFYIFMQQMIELSQQSLFQTGIRWDSHIIILLVAVPN